MAEHRTIARPYAEAVYRLADASGQFTDWSDMLANLARVAVDPSIGAAIRDPNLSSAKIAGMFLSVLADRLNGEGKNFVQVLAENRRLDFLPEIAAQFEVLKNEREGTLEAEIESAFPMDSGPLQDLVARLEAKTGKRIKPRVSVDPGLIAGVRIVIGDKVIDGSARAQLTALENALKR